MLSEGREQNITVHSQLTLTLLLPSTLQLMSQLCTLDLDSGIHWGDRDWVRS
jgi:hypothetical protein